MRFFPSKEYLTELRQTLFGTTDRVYSFISVVFGFISVALTVILWQFPSVIPHLIIIRDICIVILLLLLVLLFTFRYLQEASHNNSLTLLSTEKEQEISLLNQVINRQFADFHMIVHKFRNDLFQNYLSLIPEDVVVGENEKAFFEKICHSVTLDIKNMITSFFKQKKVSYGEDICVTVKLTLTNKNITDLYGVNFQPEIKKRLRKKNQWVITVFRDLETYEKHRERREVGNRIYSPNLSDLG